MYNNNNNIENVNQFQRFYSINVLGLASSLLYSEKLQQHYLALVSYGYAYIQNLKSASFGVINNA